jgi:site-specific DNA-cytosine methylase
MEIDNSKIRSVNNTGSIPPDELKYYRIRRLTERECYRLMDVSDDDINRVMASGIARTNHVKLAGNSIVVNCMYEIFRCLFIDNDNTDVACSGDLSGEQLTMF